MKIMFLNDTKKLYECEIDTDTSTIVSALTAYAEELGWQQGFNLDSDTWDTLIDNFSVDSFDTAVVIANGLIKSPKARITRVISGYADEYSS